MRGPPSPGPARGAETRGPGRAPAGGPPARRRSMVKSSTGSGLGSETQAREARAASASERRRREDGARMSFPRPGRSGRPSLEQQARVLAPARARPGPATRSGPELGDQPPDLRQGLALEPLHRGARSPVAVAPTPSRASRADCPACAIDSAIRSTAAAARSTRSTRRGRSALACGAVAGPSPPSPATTASRSAERRAKAWVTWRRSATAARRWRGCPGRARR